MSEGCVKVLFHVMCFVLFIEVLDSLVIPRCLICDFFWFCCEFIFVLDVFYSSVGRRWRHNLIQYGINHTPSADIDEHNHSLTRSRLL